MAELRVTTHHHIRNAVERTFIWIDLFDATAATPNFTWTWGPHTGWIPTPWKPRDGST